RADERRRLLGRVDVEHARERTRLVRDDADRVAAETREARDDVLGEARLQLQERPLVDDGLDRTLDVVRLRRLVGYEVVQLGRLAVGRIGGLIARAGLAVVL